MSAAIGETVVIHRDRFAYISHPSITCLDNGDWLAAFNHSRMRENRLHPPGDPLFRTLISRSRNQGAGWEDPVFAPSFDWYGTECPGIVQLADGTVVLSEFRFGWYPLGLAKKRRAEGENISICLPDRGWTEDFGEEDWKRSRFTWARGYHGFYTHLSQDLGECFDETVKLPSGSFRDGYSRTGVVELSDGRVAYAVTEHHPPQNRYTYLLFSEDGCRTWSEPQVIVDDRNRLFSEPDLCEVRPGELYCILRETRKTGHLHATRSVDGGKSWSEVEKTPIHGHPGHLLVLNDGQLFCTYGRRRSPFGIRARISSDGGRSWSDEIVIRDDLPNGDLGYPTTIEYEPGRLFCCYYGQDDEGITCVQGTYLKL